MVLRTDYTPGGEPGGGRDTNKVYGIDLVEIASQVNTNTTDIAAMETPTWVTLVGKPAVIAAGATQAEARTAIGAATLADITAAVDALISGAPGALDTLNELAAALGNDANFAATVTGLINAKYTKPGTGIPKTDLDAAVQTSLGLADTATQPGDLGTAAATDSTDYATAAQGALADTALQGIPDNSVTQAKMADDAVGVAELSATGTPDGTTFLRGDNTWNVPPGGGVSSWGDLTDRPVVTPGDYGALGDGSTDDTAAISAAVAAAAATESILFFPSGTYVITSQLDWKIDQLQVQGSGPGNTIIKQTTNNVGIVALAGTQQHISGITFTYASQQASASTSAVGLTFGDNTAGTCFMGSYHDLQINLAQTSMGIGATSRAGLFSCMFQGIEINGYSKSAINFNQVSGGNCTGCRFDNVYIHNNYPGTVQTCSGTPVEFANWDEFVFNQFNIEHSSVTSQPAMALNNAGPATLNALHFEGLTMSSDGKALLALNQSKAIINGGVAKYNTFTGSASNPVFSMYNWDNRCDLIVNGWTDNNNTVTTPARPVVDFSFANADCRALINGMDEGQTTIRTVNPAATASFATFGNDNSAATTTAALALKAPLASPAFTGTPTGITKTHVGLGNVDNIQQQPLDTDLTAIAALTSATDKVPYATGAGTWAMTDLSPFARTVLDDTSALAARTTLGAHVVTPEDFGAIGDGVTDNGAALESMFNSHATTNGGATIHIPYGRVYASSTPFNIRNNTFVFGGGTIKCLADNPSGTGGFILMKNAVHNVTWIGPTLDINGKTNANGFAVGDVPNSTDFVSDIYIVATVIGARIDTAGEDANDVLYSGGGKGITVQFRARNVYANVRTENCDIGCSIEAAVSSTRHLENVVIDLQAKDSHRTALFIGGSTSVSSLNSGSYQHSLYPGVKIRLRAQGGQDASITNPVTQVVGTNYDHAGVVTMNYASGIDLEVYAATAARCTLIRGMAAASTIRVNNALMDELQDAWDTRPIDTLPTGPALMVDNVFEANVHAATHYGVLVRPHRDPADTVTRTMLKTRLDVNMWCQNGVGAITQSDGTTDEFGASVAYRFCDMKSSPIKEVSGLSSDTTLPQWSLAADGGVVNAGRFTANNHIAAAEETTTAGGTKTLDVNSSQVQIFTGPSSHTVKLPTTGIRAGQSYTIINNSSGAVSVQSSNTNAIITQFFGKVVVYTAMIDAPTTSAHWSITAMTALSTTGAQTFAMRDTNGNLVSDSFISTATSIPTTGGTITLTINSSQTQVFTGTTTETVLLPTTGVVAGQSYTIINNSTGSLTVQSSGANTVATVPTNTLQLFIAQVNTPTTAAHWRAV